MSIILCYPYTLCYVDKYTTPKHIVPEWYFLPFVLWYYGGVVLLGTAVLVYVLPTTACSTSSYSYCM